MLRVAFLLALLVPAAASQLLAGIVPQVPGVGEGRDAIAIGATATIDLTGFRLTDGEGSWTFPSLELAPGQTLWIVGNATVWHVHGGPGPFVVMSPPLRLADDGDDVALLTPDGRQLDFVAYGNKDASGVLPAANPGLMLQRDGSAGSWTDTNASSDWITPRRHRIGESELDQPTFAVDAITLYASPDSSFQILSELIASARNRLHLHVYEFRSAALADALVSAKQNHPGLDLQVLVDANPVGADARDRHATADALSRIEAVGGIVVLAGNGRYDDHHLKVLVADDAVAVQSENWVESGVPVDPSWGNRGWGAVLHDDEAADWFAAWLQEDRNAWDTTPFDLATFDPLFEAPPRRAARTGDYGPRSQAVTFAGPIAVTPLVAPDHMQDPRNDPVARRIDEAQRRVDGQQLDVALHAKNVIGWRSDDPVAVALAAAAQRGLSVHLQAAPPFSASDTGNRDALAWLQERGVHTSLLDRAGLSTLHNKAFVIDDTVVLGSMNGNHHSRSANREVSLIIDDGRAAAWGRHLMAADREASHAGRDWGAPGEDLRALPSAPWPTLLALTGVVQLLRGRR